MTQYLCGDCGQQVEIKPRDPIRCRFCGYRILYKMRTKNRMSPHAPCLVANAHMLTSGPGALGRLRCATALTGISPMVCPAVIQFEARCKEVLFKPRR